MSGPLKKAASAALVAVCVWGGIRHWQATRAAVAPVPTEKTVSPSANTPASPASAPQPSATASLPLSSPANAPRDVNARLQQIVDLRQTNSLDEALAVANALVADLEPHARERSDHLGYAYLARGEIFEKMQRHEDAITEFEHVYFLWRDDTPDSGRGWLRVYDALTRAYARAKRWGETLAMADRGWKAAQATPSGDPGYGTIFLERQLDALTALDRREEAEKYADRLRAHINDVYRGRPDLRVKWLRSVAGNYRQLGLLEKHRSVLQEAAAELPDLSAPTSSVEFSKELSFAKAALAAGNRNEANRRADALRQALPHLTSPSEASAAAVALREFYDDADRYEDALALARTAAKLHDEAGQNDTATRKSDLRRIKSFLHQLGRFDEAGEVVKQLLELARKEYGEDSAEYIKELNSRASDLFFRGNPADALAQARDALARAERMQPADPTLVESCLGLIGFFITQSNAGPATEAEAALRRAIDLNESRNGKLHATAIGDHINLAAALIDQSRYDDAQGVLDGVFHALGATHALDSDFAGWAYFQQASLSERKDEHAKAFIAARRAVEIRERIFGLHNFRTRLMLRLFVDIAWKAGEKKAAIERAEQLLDSEKAAKGWSDFDTLRLCARLANWHSDTNNFTRAQELTGQLENARNDYYSRRKP